MLNQALHASGRQRRFKVDRQTRPPREPVRYLACMGNALIIRITPIIPLLAIAILIATLCSAQNANAQWQRTNTALLRNFNNMYNPCVVEVDGDHRYLMWFFVWANDHTNSQVPGCDAIYHARSHDLQNWEVYSKNESWDKTMNPRLWAPVLHASDKWYEAWHTGDPSVTIKDGMFYMAYSATSRHFSKRDGYPAAMVQCVMGAKSENGVNWTKTDQPLLIREGDHSDPKPELGRIGDFHRPSLHWDDGKWRLWFDYWHPDKGVCMGYAENHDEFGAKHGFNIRHDLATPLIANWPNPEVIRIGNNYHSFADPTGYPIKKGESPWKSRQLREAISNDGVTWKQLPFIKPDEDVDACHVPQTLLTTIDGKQMLYLFYATQIGYRKKDGMYHYQYDQIRVMRRTIK